jgi:hypothetical protein
MCTLDQLFGFLVVDHVQMWFFSMAMVKLLAEVKG